MHEFRFTFFETPRSCLRVRGRVVTPLKKKPFVTFFDPTPNREYKHAVIHYLNGVCFYRSPIKGPVEVSLTMYMPHPKSGPRRLFHQTKPDVDNLAKIILDAMNGIVYHDDKQIVCLTVRKRYCRPGDVPRTDVIIEESQDEYR
jgi:Holliday junction resolvase RusA-like endonuclease